MDVIIPTYGRATVKQQHTLSVLNKAGIVPALVVQAREADAYLGNSPALGAFNLYVLPPEHTTICTTRDYIMANVGASERVVMLDDDLIFARRRTDDPTKFARATDADVVALFDKLNTLLGTYAHVTVAPRDGANRRTDPLVTVGRAMRVLGYQRGAVAASGACFADGGLMCDFHMTLALLRRGLPNAIVNDYVNDQVGGSDTPGGCSTYRTPAVQQQAAVNLRNMHRQFVTVVEKTTKTSWGGGTRTDVRIQWKKAYDSAAK